jgi:hypothetical protein
MTNEGEGTKNVRIKANVVIWSDSTYPIVIRPATIDFPASGNLETMEFIIINKATDAITLSIVSPPRSLVGISLPPSIPALDSAKGTMTLKKAGLEAGFEKSLTIQLNDQAQSRFTIPVKRAGGGQAVVVPTGGH